MKGSIKTLATWLIIGVIFILIISAIMDNSQTKMTYSDLMVAVNNGTIDKIQIESDGTKAYVTLKNDKTEKTVNIPSLDSFMNQINDKLTAQNFTVEMKPEPILMMLLSVLWPFGLLIIFFVFWFLFMNNTQGRRE